MNSMDHHEGAHPLRSAEPMLRQHDLPKLFPAQAVCDWLRFWALGRDWAIVPRGLAGAFLWNADGVPEIGKNVCLALPTVSGTVACGSKSFKSAVGARRLRSESCGC